LVTSGQLAIEAARAADDKKATDVRIMDMRETLGITDYFVVASGANDRQVKRIRDAIEERLREYGAKPVRREGERYGRWILLDYVDFVVHVFLDEDRTFYNLERLWGNVTRMAWQDEDSIPRT
jgi:ribosome-associated protein